MKLFSRKADNPTVDISHDMVDTNDPMFGQIVAGMYRVIEPIGSGGMSSVYRGETLPAFIGGSESRPREVAIKVLRVELMEEPSQKQRFFQEARAMIRVRHENIVQIFDFGETHDGSAYLVMEYVPGEPLYRRVSRNVLTPAEGVHAMLQIARALQQIHDAGIIHRDLKPDNVLLRSRASWQGTGPFWDVKLLDFGIAKVMDAPSLTGSQHIFGTPGYIAPEYIQTSSIDGRSDIYSLGVMFYEAVTGLLPFDYQYPADLLAKHLLEPPIAPRERNPEIPVSLERVILKCLEKEPAQRYAHAGALVHELEVLSKVFERPSGLKPLVDAPVVRPVDWDMDTVDECFAELPTVMQPFFAVPSVKAASLPVHYLSEASRPNKSEPLSGSAWMGRINTLRRL